MHIHANLLGTYSMPGTVPGIAVSGVDTAELAPAPHSISQSKENIDNKHN